MHAAGEKYPLAQLLHLLLQLPGKGRRSLRPAQQGLHDRQHGLCLA
jgi:hypothetical protein